MKVVYAMLVIVAGWIMGAPSAVADDALTPPCCRVAVGEEGPKACCQASEGAEALSADCCNVQTASAEAPRRRGQGRPGASGRQQERQVPPAQQGAQHVPARDVMRGARTLVFNHQSITREIEEIPGGVRTVTTTTKPQLVPVLQKHPKEMVEHFKKGGHVRRWDPLFAELAEHYDKVDMKWRDLKNGIEITSTSKEPEVVKLIRAHAKKVSEFVARGRAAMHEATPLPEGYKSNQDAE